MGKFHWYSNSSGKKGWGRQKKQKVQKRQKVFFLPPFALLAFCAVESLSHPNC
jgi:hypothetical protein